MRLGFMHCSRNGNLRDPVRTAWAWESPAPRVMRRLLTLSVEPRAPEAFWPPPMRTLGHLRAGSPPLWIVPATHDPPVYVLHSAFLI